MVDCSGSMTGDSITQARQAINDILNQLRPEDYFNLIAFGGTCKIFSDRQIRADKKNITKVKRLLRSLDADMGGTEIDKALQATIHIPGPQIPHDILLITDGEVWETEKIISTAKKSGHRVFTVGVGSS
ncbi:MAG: VWA domain-containing protein, partial [Pseudomonadota bacterium]|nr:VWA domain-containing protein [Pseudomonadota bacterium]